MNWKTLFRFTPRAGRAEFAAVGLVCNLLTFGNLLLSFWLMSGTVPLVNAALLQILMMPVSLLVFWVGLALYSRRLHDFNLSLWWYILYVVITSAFAFTSHAGATAVSVLGVLVWAFLALKKSPDEDNRFGEKAEPFFPASFGRSAFYLTAAAGILVAASMAAFSAYSAQNIKTPSSPYAAQSARF
uniref:DUF805 domain-containing protein n=1 Tax=uncultured Elusimicrobia bacterium TaxID=699876 RepID=A0A650ELE9_9BACT|nr:hypothetical protein Elusimicrob1349_0390 [uncultured Elusimicrobia bacterium]